LYIGIRGGNSMNQLASCRTVFNDQRRISLFVESSLCVQTQIGLPCISIGTVALIAVVGKDWSNIAIEIDGCVIVVR